ncbi:MAG: hypothetical protein FWG79_03605 [Bacteroidales bacterium]|nr:hypothetical protein [Bacteroidales bacterium]
MKNTFDISRFGKFFAMEFRLFRNIILILLGVTFLDLTISMATFSNTYGMLVDAQTTTADITTEMEMDGTEPITLSNLPNLSRATDHAFEMAKLGVNPFRFGGAFGFFMLILPFLFYNFVYHPTKSLTYSMLPASWLEKFMSAWTMCVIAVPILLFAFSLLVAFVGELVGAQISWHALNLKDFFNGFYVPTIGAQAVAFWGVFWFRNKKAQKTILTMVIFVIAMIFLLSYYRDNLYFLEKMADISRSAAMLFAYLLMVVLWGLALIKYPRTQI